MACRWSGCGTDVHCIKHHGSWLRYSTVCTCTCSCTLASPPLGPVCLAVVYTSTCLARGGIDNRVVRVGGYLWVWVWVWREVLLLSSTCCKGRRRGIAPTHAAQAAGRPSPQSTTSPSPPVHHPPLAPSPSRRRRGGWPVDTHQYMYLTGEDQDPPSRIPVPEVPIIASPTPPPAPHILLH